jgi:hypothetical protein
MSGLEERTTKNVQTRRQPMCVDHKMTCACGKNSASFNFRDDILTYEVINRLYCPTCSSSVGVNPDTMLSDNGWIIEYDMDRARLLCQKIWHNEAITPEFIFDEGYCTWRGTYPNDHIDSAKERTELSKLAKTEPKRYFNELRTWGINRMERLAREGWRKARETESVNT